MQVYDESEIDTLFETDTANNYKEWTVENSTEIISNYSYVSYSCNPRNNPRTFYSSMYYVLYKKK